MKKNIAGLMRYLLIITLLAGCAKFDKYDSDVYSDREINSSAETFACTVVGKRKIKIKNSCETTPVVGGIAGAVTGGLLGNLIGGRTTTTILAVAGGAAGTAAGASVANNEEGYEYTVKITDSGALKTLVQGTDIVLNVGDKAYYILPLQGRKNTTRARLVPFN